MNLGQNSVMPRFVRGGAEDSKTQNLPLFKPVNRKSKVVKHIKKSTLKSIRTGDMGIFLLLDRKKCCSSPISPPNGARNFHHIFEFVLRITPFKIKLGN